MKSPVGTTVPHSSAVLVWPSAASKLNLQRPGYLLGWENEHICNKSDSVVRTTICAGVIPLKCSLGNRSVPFETEFVQRALGVWSERYKCCAKRDRQKEDEYCSCFFCGCHGSFCIIGLWDPMKAQEETDLPRIVPTSWGPWWQKEYASESLSTQLLLYDSCEGLTFYRQNTQWHPKVLDLSSVPGFRQTLLRVSEAQALFEAFRETLMKELTLAVGDHNVQAGVGVQHQYHRESVSTDSSHAQVVRESVTTDSRKDHERFSIRARLRRGIAGNSLLMNHFSTVRHTFYHQKQAYQSVPLFLRPLPIAWACWLLVGLINNTRVSHNRKCKPAPCVPSELASKSVIRNVEAVTCTGIDAFLGLVSGFVILGSVDPILEMAGIVWNFFHNRMLRENIGWLETFPVGFKLNVPLTGNMGAEINMLVGTHDWISALLLSDSSKRWMVMIACSFGVLFGMSGLLALVFDGIRISTIHITVFAKCFQKMHRAQLYLLSSLWLLFQGKKRNVLRHRSDTMEYDSTQLLLGVLLFSMVLFLFTTVLVYYAFFAFLHLVVNSLLVAVWAAYVTTRLFPAGTCILRIYFPGWFTQNVYLEEILPDPTPREFFDLIGQHAIIPAPSDGAGCPRNVVRLVAVPQTLSAITAEAWSGPFAAMASEIQSVIWAVIVGLPTSPAQVCLQSVDSVSNENHG